MATVISRRKLDAGDFAGWMSRFEAGASARQQAGCRGLRRLRSIDDPNEVIVIFDWDSLENARAFIDGNARLLQARDPQARAPDMQTYYVEELEPLDS